MVKSLSVGSSTIMENQTSSKKSFTGIEAPSYGDWCQNPLLHVQSANIAASAQTLWQILVAAGGQQILLYVEYFIGMV